MDKNFIVFVHYNFKKTISKYFNYYFFYSLIANIFLKKYRSTQMAAVMQPSIDSLLGLISNNNQTMSIIDNQRAVQLIEIY
jgi:hypothetical protein